MSDYAFVTEWDLDAPVARVWDEIHASEAWPTWWPGVEAVTEVRANGPDGIGGVRRYVWKSKLPYRLGFEMELTRMERHALLEGVARGELDGLGTWRFTAVGPSRTHVRYDWTVRATKWWMVALAPIARPLFEWNHDVVMEWGRVALVRRLATDALERTA